MKYFKMWFLFEKNHIFLRKFARKGCQKVKNSLDYHSKKVNGGFCYETI